MAGVIRLHFSTFGLHLIMAPTCLTMGDGALLRLWRWLRRESRRAWQGGEGERRGERGGRGGGGGKGGGGREGEGGREKDGQCVEIKGNNYKYFQQDTQ